MPGDDMEPQSHQRRKNWALAGGLLALVVLFYLITLVKLGGGG
jgi:hypothetical protein